METLPPTPHPATTCINYCIGAEDSPIRDRVAIIPSNPNQLMDLASQAMYNREGQEVQVFDAMGNVCSEVLVKIPRMGLTIRSREPLPKSSNHGSDYSETFAFGNDGSD